MADTTVKYFHSAMVGAPVLNGTAGAIIAILDACLVNGFGSGTLDSLVISGGVATATKSTGHSQEANSVVSIAGATVTGGSVNGEHKVISTTTTTFTFDATGISNQTATGTITAKLAPAGWTKQYTGTNLAAYKSSDVGATGCLLRVDDTATLNARVVGYETMSDINTGTGQFPTSAQVSGGDYWTKSSNANSTANSWMLVADGRMFYFARAYRSGNNASQVNENQLHVFGDLIPTKAGDAYSCIISGETLDVSGSNITQTNNYWYGTSGPASGLYCPRPYTGLGSSVQMGKYYPQMNGNTAGASGTNSGATPYPNPTDGGVYVVPHYIFDGASNVYRGLSPGFYCSPQFVPNGQFASRDNVTGVTGLSGKVLKALTCQNSTWGVCFLDITGPWR